MDEKKVKIYMCLFCMVGLVAALWAVVKVSDNDKDLMSSTQKSVEALCNRALYKATCIRTLNTANTNASATTHDVIKTGAKFTLKVVAGNSNATKALKATTRAAAMALSGCVDLMERATERLTDAVAEIEDASMYRNPNATWRVRMWLSDAVTYHTNCMDGIAMMNATDLNNTMRESVINGTEMTMSVLDVVTHFSQALSGDATGESADEETIGGGEKKGRRLLAAAAAGGDWWSEAEGRVLDEADAVVATDDSGDFKSINEALRAYKTPSNGGRYKIRVKAGTYNETVLVNKKMVNVTMYGDGPGKTVVIGNLSYNKDNLPTSMTATFAVEGANFVCKNMGFKNTAGPSGHQAVALRANGDHQVFFNCSFVGYQDTLFTQGGSQLFRDCRIYGTIDFIFGNGATLIQKSNITVLQPINGQVNTITAQGREGPSQPTALILQHCRIKADSNLDKKSVKTYLARPWKKYARTVLLRCEIGDLVSSGGYRDWDKGSFNTTAYCGEYDNTGPGAKERLPGVKVLNREQAQSYTGKVFMPGADGWLKPSGVPYYKGFKP